MAKHGDRAREALLDAAEELFATHGIDSVSNRRIAEHAGNANHSAVGYHFGSRDGLLRAMVARHTAGTRERRAERAALLPDEPTFADLLGTLILPGTETFASLPVPSWRARFLRQLRNTPSAEAILGSEAADPLAEQLAGRIGTFTEHIPRNTLVGRGRLLGSMITDVCAEYEAGIAEGVFEPDWTAVGYFLTDAAAGMLSAAVTHPSDFHTVDSRAFIF
ncbi:helix-turn-helix domain-containing protein [Rhodococcus sp. HNM0569]|uniref:TetR/AcrR family transcriptional regulator n=1 Tax=Rhodococcus sp. HNM0569 TaxID=2716340 RepID=UPI00146DA1CA|nr:helix-turn-helix domain-containing protein [Rhodococcus sp. HNM0569]NLU84261.1 helix-turn-helix transcriptional regulator [Rhodococcus sp. HNM0569]